jgi:hypothetical protein
MSKPILCVDFDGVIHSYSSGWKGSAVVADPPVPGALQWLWSATEVFDVQVYSSRSKDEAGRRAMFSWMIEESRKTFPHGHPMCWTDDAGDQGPVYPITFCHEKPAAFLTIDDRAICFYGDWSKLDPAKLLKFKPWNKQTESGPDQSSKDAQRLIRVAKALAEDANKSHLARYVNRDPISLDFEVKYRSKEAVEAWLNGAWPAFADLAATVIKACDESEQ